MNIGFSITYARQLLAVPNTGFNVIQASYVSPYGRGFIRELQTHHHRQVYSWTVNDEKNMDWCIRRGMDGVVTDDVPKFLEMCRTFEEGKRYQWSVKMVLRFIISNIWVFIFNTIYLRWHGTCIDGRARADKNE